MTSAQKSMLMMVMESERHPKGPAEVSTIVMECATAYEGALAWRTADRTLGACLRRGWVVVEDGADSIRLTDEGRRLLAEAR